MSTSKLCILFLVGGKYIWCNFRRTLKNQVLYTYAWSFTKKAKTSPQGTFSQNENCNPYSSPKVLTYIVSAPILSDPSELEHLILLACLIIGLYLSITPCLKKIEISELEVFPCEFKKSRVKPQWCK